MKKVDLIRLNQNLLKVMSDNDIKTSDVLFLGAYEDFMRIRAKEKYSVSVTEVSSLYGVSERTIGRMVAKFNEELKV